MREIKFRGRRIDTCEWKVDTYEWNDYRTSCENHFMLEDGTPEDNGMKFCPYCGKRLGEVSHETKTMQVRCGQTQSDNS